MFKTIQSTWPADKDYAARTYRLNILTKVLDGALYDNLQNAFHEEKTAAGEYVELRKRRPSVRYPLCRMVVDDSVSLLFSEGHFPAITCKDEKQQDALITLAKELRLNDVFINAATRGSVGSVAILLRVLDSRPFLTVMETAYLKPVWKATAPDTLERIEERYKVKGEALKALGYTIPEDTLKTDYWFARDFTEVEETWYLPLKVSDQRDGRALIRDDAKSLAHKLGFVPVVWIKNLPGGDDIDGAPTLHDEAIDTSIEIDYQLSQAGRGLKYSADPTLLIKEPAFGTQTKTGGASNAIVVSAEGDAHLLEINGTAAQAVIEYVRFLREIALESLHGNRANAEKQSAAPSGRALEMMNQALIWLADKLRISYGEGGLRELLGMLVKAHAKFPLKLKNGQRVPEIPANAEIGLRWPKWYPQTPDDLQTMASTLQTLVDAGLLSRQTAINVLASEYDIADPVAEKALAEAELAARNADAQKQVKISE